MPLAEAWAALVEPLAPRATHVRAKRRRSRRLGSATRGFLFFFLKSYEKGIVKKIFSKAKCESKKLKM